MLHITLTCTANIFSSPSSLSLQARNKTLLHIFIFNSIILEMESNRDAADQCYAKAVAALKVGDVDKAKRMAEKSIRLFETTRAAEFLEVCNVTDRHILI